MFFKTLVLFSHQLNHTYKNNISFDEGPSQQKYIGPLSASERHSGMTGC